MMFDQSSSPYNYCSSLERLRSHKKLPNSSININHAHNFTSGCQQVHVTTTLCQSNAPLGKPLKVQMPSWINGLCLVYFYKCIVLQLPTAVLYCQGLPLCLLSSLRNQSMTMLPSVPPLCFSWLLFAQLHHSRLLCCLHCLRLTVSLLFIHSICAK